MRRDTPVARHVTPASGLVTAIIAGLICALFGGTRLAVSGPAAAMAVLTASIVASHGTAGLLVVYVDPVTPAFEAGLQPGDVIQSINGKSVSLFKTDTKPATYTFEVVRKKEKLVVTIPVKQK